MGDKLVSGVSGIPFFNDWVPYHYIFQAFLVGFQYIFDDWNSTTPPSNILITIRHLVPGIWSV